MDFSISGMDPKTTFRNFYFYQDQLLQKGDAKQVQIMLTESIKREVHHMGDSNIVISDSLCNNAQYPCNHVLSMQIFHLIVIGKYEFIATKSDIGFAIKLPKNSKDPAVINSKNLAIDTKCTVGVFDPDNTPIGIFYLSPPANIFQEDKPGFVKSLSNMLKSSKNLKKDFGNK